MLDYNLAKRIYKNTRQELLLVLSRRKYIPELGD